MTPAEAARRRAIEIAYLQFQQAMVRHGGQFEAFNEVLDNALKAQDKAWSDAVGNRLGVLTVVPATNSTTGTPGQLIESTESDKHLAYEWLRAVSIGQLEQAREIAVSLGDGMHERAAAIMFSEISRLQDLQAAPAARTPADYAIEHGEYLATAAQDFLIAVNNYDAAQDGEGGEDVAREARSEHWTALHSAIYEFRKRAARAKPVSPAVSMEQAGK